MLQINRDADYALRLMLEVGSHTQGTLTTAKVASLQEIPYEFLRKIVQTLVSHGILVSERGAHGGVALARPAEDISVLDITRAFGPVALNHCTADPPRCDLRQACAVHPVWIEAQNQVERVLGGARLSELVVRQAMLKRPSPTHGSPDEDSPEVLGAKH